MVEEAQAEVEEVRRKEVRDAKFQYASITFDTFKPAPAEQSAAQSLYQPQDEEQQHDHRLPSFARNFNPIANRAMLARSYEIVTPSGTTATKSGTKSPATGTSDLQLEEYDKLIHQERKMTGASQRKMTGASQRKFSISTIVHGLRTNYSQLEINSKPSLTKRETAETTELGVKKIKPTIKKRTVMKADAEKPPSKIPSYSLVQKPKAPPLPHRYDHDPQEEAAKEEEHYKVPRSVHRREMDTYDCPSSQVRVAWSCENIQSQDQSWQMNPRVSTSSDFEIYDTPTTFPRGRAVCSQRSLVHEEPLYTNSIAEVLQNSVSVGSYIDMTGSQVSYI